MLDCVFMLSMKVYPVVFFAFIFSLASGFLSASGGERWYRGNTHTHTLWSDGDDLPESVADWYKRHGYHFLVLSDHNILSRGERWKTLRADEAVPVLQKAAKRWGKDHVQTRIHEGEKQVRLMPLSEVRKLVEKPKKFIMIEGIELTSGPSGFAVHSNPLNVSEHLEVHRKTSRSVVEDLADHERLVYEHQAKTGDPVFWQVNHPNYKFSVTGEMLADIEGLHGVEIMNSSSNCFNLGDGSRPSLERIWDIANTLRLKRGGLPPIYGTATDDTHDYHVGDYVMNAPGTSWVMVRARALTPNAIAKAMQQGMFYSTTGVILKKLEFDAEAGTLTVVVKKKKGLNYRIDFIGTHKEASLDHEEVEAIVDEKGLSHPVTADYADERIGMSLQSTEGSKAVYRMTGDELYVRGVVHCDAPPYFKYDAYSDFVQKAWTQPVGWKN
ncbi:MAG: hypothetical protein HN457_02700 [Opitutales bacterium]|nr:hypothetical protein [Opitutales bacterium]MDG2254787.1 hypothetical protein [Opitutaceae bacterium]